MNVIVIFSCAQYREELLIRVASCGAPGLVWSQVARVKVLETRKWAEVSAAAQVGGRIDLLLPEEWAIGRRQEVRVPRGKILSLRTLAMAPIAAGLCVYDVAA
jgi:hypothetical protein